MDAVAAAEAPFSEQAAFAQVVEFRDSTLTPGLVEGLDVAGRVVWISSSEGTWGLRHDARGRIVELADALGDSTQLTYDAGGCRVEARHQRMLAGSWKERAVCDAGGRPVAVMVDPDAGTLGDVEAKLLAAGIDPAAVQPAPTVREIADPAGTTTTRSTPYAEASTWTPTGLSAGILARERTQFRNVSMTVEAWAAEGLPLQLFRRPESQSPRFDGDSRGSALGRQERGSPVPRQPHVERDRERSTPEVSPLSRVSELVTSRWQASLGLGLILSLLPRAGGAGAPASWQALRAAGDLAMAEAAIPVAGRYWRAAEQFYLGALEVAEQQEAGSAVVADLLLALSRPEKYLGRYGESSRHLERALALAEEAHGAQAPELCPILDELGNLYVPLERPGDALRVFERSRAIRERVYGPESVEVAASLMLLAATHHGEGELEEALALYRRALAIRDARLPPEDDLISQALASTAEVLRLLGREEEAAPLRERFRRITP